MWIEGDGERKAIGVRDQEPKNYGALSVIAKERKREGKTERGGVKMSLIYI